MRDLNGIPGSESLRICLTGYQRNDREDIMKMASLMGAQFSKPLIAHVVTHLICYKFEGEKYELAKRVNIKLVNHRWLEDCLKSWEILPVDDYSKSSWELEIMEAQAKDSEDEAEDLYRKSFNGRSSAKFTPNPKNSAGTSAKPDVNAPIRSPIIPSGNREMVVERHLNTLGHIRKTEDAGNMTHDITTQGTPSTSRLAISANADVGTPTQTPFILSSNRGDAAVRNLNSPNQTREAEYKYVGTRTLDISTGAPGTPSSSRMAVSANQHFHSSNEALTIPNGNTDNVARKRLDNHGQIDVSKAHLTTPSRENWFANVLDSCNVDRGQHQEDGAASNLSAVAGWSNVDDKLANHEVNLKSGGNATPNNINNVSCSRKALQKSLSPEGLSVHQMASPQRAVGNTLRADSNISSLGKGDENFAEFVDIQNLKGDENIKNVDGQDVAYAHKRKCLISPASLKPQNGDLASKTGALCSPFVSRLSDTSELAITSSVGTNPTEATNVDLGKQQPGSSKSKQSRYRSSVKHGGPVDGVKLPEYSTSDRNVESLLKPRASLKAMAENKCTRCPSATVQDGKRNPGFSFQNKNGEVAHDSGNVVSQYGLLLMHETENAHTKDSAPDISLHSSRNLQLVTCSGKHDTEMTDILDVNKNEAAVASNFKLEKVVSVDNVKAGLKYLPGTSSNALCETSYPKKVATRARNAGAKRPRSSMEVDGSVVNNGKAVVSEAEPYKMIPQEHAGAISKNGSSSARVAECKTNLKVPISGVRNTIAKRSRIVHTKVSDAQVASHLELSKVISQENIETDPKKVLSSASADEHQRNSPMKLPNTRVRNTVAKRSRKSDTNMTGESSVGKTETSAAESLFDDLIPSENVEDCPKKLSSSASADDCETLSPRNVSTTRVRKMVAKRKIKAVEDKSSSKRDKIGSAIVSAAKGVSSKKIKESSCSINKVTADQDTQKANKDGTRDVSGLFSKDTVTVDKLEGLHNSKLRCSKRNKALASDHEKEENRQDRGNLSSKSNGRTDSLNSKFDSKSKQNNADMLDKHQRIKGNRAGTLITLEPACFILSGHRQQRRDYRTILRRLKGRVCRDSHHWSYQATHFIAPDPLRRTEKFFAAAAAGRWILKSDYLTSCNEAGKFLDEEPFEWFGTDLNDGETISFEAPRKWRILRQQMGHGAFYGMQIIVYGQLISPSLDTLKRAVRAGDGTILATSPPYTRFLNSGVDFAVVSASMPSADAWVQEFMSHNIPCVSTDYLVEYICKPGYPLDRHVLFKTNDLANKSLDKLLKNQQEVATDKPEPLEDGDPDDLSCSVCGRMDRGEVMLICGDEEGAAGCGVGMHIDCCDPPLEAVPDDNWLCPKCDVSKVTKKPARETGSKSRRSKRR